ncbi:MAG: discoidin domain-containing protein [Bacteroidota bacterium]
MDRIRKMGSVLSLAGLVFLWFLFVFEEQLHIPSWLQVVGRMHPLMLHFPIVLLLISLVSYWLPENYAEGYGWELIRLFAALTALLSAIMGMLLSIEQADKGDTLVYHKWMGVSLATIAWALYTFHQKIAERKIFAKSISIASVFVLLVTGHLGANLTHGENFLTGPVMSRHKKIIDPETAMIYRDIIYPILNEKCGGCHQSGNRKGGLSLNDSVTIMAGGKTGKALVAGDLLQSLMISRLHLPLSDKKHMPLATKPQLSSEELNLLEAWVKAGARFSHKLKDRIVTDSLRLSANAYISSQKETETEIAYDFAEADPATTNKLNNNYRVIKQLGKNSPALTVSFFGKAMYSTEKLKELNPVKEQIIHLNLAKMPVTDEQVKWIAELPNLRRLNVNYSDITDRSMQLLAGMKNLESLSVSGTAVSIAGLNALVSNKKIKEVFVWDSKIKLQDTRSLQQKNPQLKIETGFQGADTMVIALNKPLIKTPQGFFHDSGKIVLAHVIKNVELRYSLDTFKVDSINGPIYKEPIIIHKDVSLQVRAFKKGWLPSEVVKASYLKAGIPIASTTLLNPADPKYNQNAEKTLTDLDLGDPGDLSTKWLGFMNNDALIVFDMGAVKKIEQVRVNALHNIGAYIFPPVSLTVWGSNDQKNWVLLNRITPEAPKKMIPTVTYLHSLHFKPASFRYIKLQGTRIKKLPDWHPGKGKPGWFFMSEVIVD